jgi:RES domain-containing protein
MLVYRITHKSFSSELFAPGIKGRWNSAGKKVVYCAESIALAFLENMVRRQGVGFNHDFKTMLIDIADDVKITVIQASGLKPGWRDFRDYSCCQPLGDRWYDEGKTAVLKVPSAVLPEANNYVLNAEHADYKKIR